jgi:N-acetylglucosaminyldiphosphoundecaprenol N-acetyl-beta-D-mannosaminyltransferase
MKIKDLILLTKDLKENEVLEYFIENSQNNLGKKLVVSINPEIIMLALKDKEFEAILKSAELALNDGVGVSIAAKILGVPIHGRVHGSDIVEMLCREIAKRPITAGFLGGKQNVAEKASERLKEKYPGLKISYVEQEPTDMGKIRADILFVAFGSPKQEKWLGKNLPSLDVNVAMGVGGAFDYISGRVSRAPKVMRRLGLEWLYRLIREPWRIKRQIKLPIFMLLVLREKLLGSD